MITETNKIEGPMIAVAQFNVYAERGLATSICVQLIKQRRIKKKSMKEKVK